MAVGSVNSLLSMATGALTASQVAISTTGNNISNVDTVGYSRQSVLLQANISLDTSAGQLGTGVNAAGVYRAYDKFIESSLIKQLGTAARYDNAYYALRNIEDFFNESTTDGIGSSLTSLFGSWSDVAQTPDSQAARQALISSSQQLADMINTVDDGLEAMQLELETLIRDEVNNANSLITRIAELNRQINIYSRQASDPNALLDERDQLVRELAEIIDITVQDNGAGNYYVSTGAGHLLVQEDVAYSLSILGPNAENNLTADSPYKQSTGSGTVGFSGTDTCEYTIEVVTAGGVDVDAQFRVSLDGGRTWLTNDDGSVALFSANSEENSVKAGELEIWFDDGAALAKGDKFVISPKNDVYWNSPTSGPINISSQSYADGTYNPLRITGGALAGYLTARDDMIGAYRDDLDALAQALIWETNRLHSQGVGLEPMTSALGTNSVGRTDQPLGSDTAQFAWSSYLSAGNISFSIYDATTGDALIPYPGMDVFSGVNFDPETMSLEDVAAVINAASFTDASGATITPLSARIVNGQLEISTTSPDYTFAVGSDTTGLLAGLGINTFFTGTDASSIAIRGELVTNPNLINAGSVNGAGEINAGDNNIANSIAALLDTTVSLTSGSKSAVQQSLIDFYATLVTKVGADTQSVKTTATREVQLAQNLSDRREEVVGVSLDEELTNLVKFQSSYQAAAKLVTTADEMLQTIIGMKQ